MKLHHRVQTKAEKTRERDEAAEQWNTNE